jgi:transcriptional regulator with XRE-family HTH domain
MANDLRYSGVSSREADCQAFQLRLFVDYFPWIAQVIRARFPGMHLKDILARNIRLLRWSKGWSQEELAHQADVDRGHVSSMENAKNNAQLNSIEKIAVAFGLEPLAMLRTETGDLVNMTDVEARRPRPGRKATGTIPPRKRRAPPPSSAEP